MRALLLALMMSVAPIAAGQTAGEPASADGDRMAWWREARFEWPEDGRLVLEGIRVRSAPHLLADGDPLEIEAGDSELVVLLPDIPPSTIASVLVLETE